MAERKLSKKAVLLWSTGVLFLLPGAYFVFLGNRPFHFAERSAGTLLLLMSVALVMAARRETRQAREQDLRKRLEKSEL